MKTWNRNTRKMIRLSELEAPNVGSEPQALFHQADNWGNEYSGTFVTHSIWKTSWEALLLMIESWDTTISIGVNTGPKPANDR